MKVYAKQINPEYQESYLFDDDGMGTEYINVCGNKDFQSRTSKLFDRVKECLDNGELAEAIEDIKTGGYYSSFYENVTQRKNGTIGRLTVVAKVTGIMFIILFSIGRKKGLMLLKQCILTLDRNGLFTMRKQSQKARKILAAIQCIALVGMMRGSRKS